MADLGTPWVQRTWGAQVAAHALRSGADAVCEYSGRLIPLTFLHVFLALLVPVNCLL